MPSSSRVVGGCTLSYFDSNESADLKFQFCNFERNFTLSNLKIKYGILSFGLWPCQKVCLFWNQNLFGFYFEPTLN